MDRLNSSLLNGTLAMAITEVQQCIIDRFYTIDVILLIVLSITIITSLVANGLIIIVFYKCKDLRSPVFCFVLNMSISDIFLPLLRLVFIIFFRSSMIHTELSDSIALALCKLSPYFEGVSIAVSMQSLVAITLQRFFAIVFPLKLRVESSKLCAIVITFVWIVALLSQIPEIVARDLSNVFGICTYSLTPLLQQYLLLRMVAFCTVPFVIMVVLYGFIIFKLRKPNLPGDVSFEQKEKRRRRNKRLTKILLTIMVSFFICWSTFDILRWAFLFSPSCSLLLAVFYAEPLPIIYSASNGLIWFIFSKTYRKALIRVWSGFNKLSSYKRNTTSRDK